MELEWLAVLDVGTAIIMFCGTRGRPWRALDEAVVIVVVTTVEAGMVEDEDDDVELVVELPEVP